MRKSIFLSGEPAGEGEDPELIPAAGNGSAEAAARTRNLWRTTLRVSRALFLRFARMALRFRRASLTCSRRRPRFLRRSSARSVATGTRPGWSGVCGPDFRSQRSRKGTTASQVWRFDQGGRSRGPPGRGRLGSWRLGIPLRPLWLRRRSGDQGLPRKPRPRHARRPGTVPWRPVRREGWRERRSCR